MHKKFSCNQIFEVQNAPPLECILYVAKLMVSILSTNQKRTTLLYLKLSKLSTNHIPLFASNISWKKCQKKIQQKFTVFVVLYRIKVLYFTVSNISTNHSNAFCTLLFLFFNGPITARHSCREVPLFTFILNGVIVFEKVYHLYPLWI